MVTDGVTEMEAIVRGRLSVNPNGCFAVGDNVLVAPPGSRVVDADTIVVPRLGEVSTEEELSASGGILHAEEVDDVVVDTSCLVNSNDGFAFITAEE